VIGAGAEYGMCVGPNGDNCASSGMSGFADFSDTKVDFFFIGSTFPTTGTFTLLFNGFNTSILNVTYSSGSLISGSFALTSFGSTSILFTGSVTGSNFGAFGGRTIEFNITSAPEPAVASGTVLGLLAIGLIARRKRASRA
jgi:hypothetical protein